MKFFNHTIKEDSPEARLIYARFELVYTIVDFLAAFLFIVGSILFFYERFVYFGTWLFLIGSVFFAFKPTIRLTREWKMLRMGNLDLLDRRGREP